LETDKDYSYIAEKNSKKIVDLFNNYINELYSLNNLNDLSLISSLTQRNTFTSKLFPYIERIFVLNQLKLLGRHDVKHIQSTELLKQKITFSLKLKFYFFLIFWSIAKNFLPKNNELNKYKNDLFLEIFENGSKGSDLGSHYYPNLSEKIAFSQNKICYLINALNINSFGDVIRLRKKIVRSNFDYIFYDVELKFRDICKYFKDCEDASKNYVNIPNFLGINMRPIFTRILEEEKYSRTNLFAHFKYRKFLDDDAYSQQSTILLWNENHAYDRALCLANKRRQKKLNLVGHAGYIESKEKNCLTITRYERVNGVVPNKVFKLFKTKDDIKSYQAPAFRYDTFFNDIELTEPKENVVIAFPLAKYQMNLMKLIETAQKLKDLNINFEYKFHPLQTYEQKKLIKQLLSQAPSNEKLASLLAKSKILISSGLSGVYLDAFFFLTPSINLTVNKNIDNNIFVNPALFTRKDQRNFEQFYFIADKFSTVKKLVDNPPIISFESKNNLKNAFINPDSSNIMAFFNDVKKT
tara:strand:+ start:25964 stop:27535 length:1572 start_codon:yes stop_codon:yes gene_type:complete